MDLTKCTLVELRQLAKEQEIKKGRANRIADKA